MRNFRENRTPDEIIDMMVGLLDDQRISNEIDEPIDKAARAFHWEAEQGGSHCEFNRLIAGFVGHVYETGLRLPRRLSKAEALAEAIFLLKKGYPDSHGDGYDEALLYASDARLEKTERILSALVETIKAIERNKYMEWVFLEHIDPLNWSLKVDVATVYRKRNAPFLPDELLNLSPYRLANYLLDFMKSCL